VDGSIAAADGFWAHRSVSEMATAFKSIKAQTWNERTKIVNFLVARGYAVEVVEGYEYYTIFYYDSGKPGVVVTPPNKEGD